MNEFVPDSCDGTAKPFINSRYGLASLRRLLRQLDVPYYDKLNPEQLPRWTMLNVGPDIIIPGLSVRRIGKKKCPETSQSILAPTDITQTYLEVCIMRHPSLKDHSYIPKLLGVTLISPLGDSFSYQFGLIVNEFHGTLEDLFVVERKEPQDPRPYLISWTEREEIALQCAEGLSVLHDCNILHNNIQPSSFTVYITHPSPSTRTINVKISNFGHAILVTPESILDDVPPANGDWSSIGPLANCVLSPFCRDIHSFGLMVMYLSYYEFMNVEECMAFLKSERGFYDELAMHPAFISGLSLFHVVSRCCISHEGRPISMHWVAPTIKTYGPRKPKLTIRDYRSAVVENNLGWLRLTLNYPPPSSILDLQHEVNYFHLGNSNCSFSSFVYKRQSRKCSTNASSENPYGQRRRVLTLWIHYISAFATCMVLAPSVMNTLLYIGVWWQPIGALAQRNPSSKCFMTRTSTQQ
jgi:serine/threonine protein kinase